MFLFVLLGRLARQFRHPLQRQLAPTPFGLQKCCLSVPTWPATALFGHVGGFQLVTTYCGRSHTAYQQILKRLAFTDQSNRRQLPPSSKRQPCRNDSFHSVAHRHKALRQPLARIHGMVLCVCRRARIAARHQVACPDGSSHPAHIEPMSTCLIMVRRLWHSLRIRRSS